MQTALASHEAERTGIGRPASARVPERRCLVTRQSLPVERLIRFVVGPDGVLVPDIEGRLPGRGLWVQANRAIVDEACATRAFAKAARAAVTVEPALADLVQRLLARRCLDLLGLARRTGSAVAGYEKAREFLRRGRPALIFVARDAADGGRGGVAGAAPGTPVVALFSSAELGAVFGRERTVHVVVAESGIAARLAVECARLAGFRPADHAEQPG